MGHRRYTLERKIQFLDAFERLGSIAAAAREVGLPNVEPCHYWLKHKEALRNDYELSLKPVEPTERVQRELQRIPLEEKIRCNPGHRGGAQCPPGLHRVSTGACPPSKAGTSQKMDF